jgi:hypothetical protein
MCWLQTLTRENGVGWGEIVNVFDHLHRDDFTAFRRQVET